MISSTLTSELAGCTITREVTATVKVEMRPSKLMKLLAESLLAEIQRIVPYSGYKPTAELEVNDILSYLHTLIWMRVCHVNEDHSKTYLLYKKLGKQLEVPVLLYQLCISIGKAYDADYALQFVPEYSVASENLLAPEQMVDLSNILLSLRKDGLATVTGLPRSQEGELDFMAMCHVEEAVRSYRNSHPVYGFLAAFFEQQKLNEITGMMCRILYGYETDYALMVRRLVIQTKAAMPEVKND